jgi:hypothetical protein
LGQATFNVKEVMFLMKMTNFQRSDNKVHKKIWSSMEETLDEPDDNIPINARKISRFLEHKETLQRSTRLRPILPVRQTVLVAPYIVLISMLRDVISDNIDPRVIHGAKT